MGSRIQCVKIIEALLVLTIPIVQRGWYKFVGDLQGMDMLYFWTSSSNADGVYSTHDELVDLGFPIVVVNSWAEVTRTNLTKWWHELAPRLMSFRRNCLT